MNICNLTNFLITETAGTNFGCVCDTQRIQQIVDEQLPTIHGQLATLQNALETANGRVAVLNTDRARITNACLDFIGTIAQSNHGNHENHENHGNHGKRGKHGDREEDNVSHTDLQIAMEQLAGPLQELNVRVAALVAPYEQEMFGYIVGVGKNIQRNWNPEHLIYLSHIQIEKFCQVMNPSADIGELEIITARRQILEVAETQRFWHRVIPGASFQHIMSEVDRFREHHTAFRQAAAAYLRSAKTFFGDGDNRFTRVGHFPADSVRQNREVQPPPQVSRGSNLPGLPIAPPQHQSEIEEQMRQVELATSQKAYETSTKRSKH